VNDGGRIEIGHGRTGIQQPTADVELLRSESELERKALLRRGVCSSIQKQPHNRSSTFSYCRWQAVVQHALGNRGVIEHVPQHARRCRVRSLANNGVRQVLEVEALRQQELERLE
jgi:hypothetical protein